VLEAVHVFDEHTKSWMHMAAHVALDSEPPERGTHWLSTQA
jgi:hypothetical protein